MTLSATTTAASDLARKALLETIPADHVGKALDSVSQDSDDSAVAIATHTFECTSPAYPGWYWEVSVVGVSGQENLTVSEINLLPGSAALVPSEWKPWADRVEAGDLGVGDLLPPPENDERLTAGFTGLDEFSEDLEPLHPQQWEMGLGREQVLSPLGLERAVDRWFDKLNGPRAAMAGAGPPGARPAARCASHGRRGAAVLPGARGSRARARLVVRAHRDRLRRGPSGAGVAGHPARHPAPGQARQ